MLTVTEQYVIIQYELTLADGLFTAKWAVSSHPTLWPVTDIVKKNRQYASTIEKINKAIYLRQLTYCRLPQTAFFSQNYAASANELIMNY